MDRLSDVLRSCQAKVDLGIYVQIPHFLWGDADNPPQLGEKCERFMDYEEAQQELQTKGRVAVCALGAIALETGNKGVGHGGLNQLFQGAPRDYEIVKLNNGDSGPEPNLTFGQIADKVQEAEEAWEREHGPIT